MCYPPAFFIYFNLYFKFRICFNSKSNIYFNFCFYSYFYFYPSFYFYLLLQLLSPLSARRLINTNVAREGELIDERKA